ncbi:hypothetical protein ACET3Z_032008 [Daucus carota]
MATVTKGKNSNRLLGNSGNHSKSVEGVIGGGKISDADKGTDDLGSTSHNLKEGQLGSNQVQEGDKQLQLDKVLKHWFFIDNELVTALNKGNHSLLPLALARVNYLIGVVPSELLAEGLKGEEEALWSIHEFLFNNGWWEKADNLKLDPNRKKGRDSSAPLQSFLKAYEHLIHPNSRVGAFQGNNEAVRMALNQIHYGSIEEARKDAKGEARKSSTSNTQNKVSFHYQLQIAKEYINAYKHLVEPSVLRDAMNGDDKALSLALGQIHHKTIPQGIADLSSKSYKEALLSPPKGPLAKPVKPRKEGPRQTTIPVTPRTTQGEFDELPDKDGAEMPELELHTSNWIPRENESSISLQRSSSGMNISEVNDELETTISDEGTNCSDMLLELKNLKVQGKRGRPHKHNKVPMNKYFKLPRKKKVRGEGLKQTSHFFLNANFDEAEAIFETGLMMGLLPLNSKDRSIELIKENLK